MINAFDKNTHKPIADFTKKKNVSVPGSLMRDEAIKIPYIFYWEDVDKNGVSSLMTMAFKFKGGNYGMSYPIEDDNFVKKNMLRKKLYNYVKEALDVLVHHGERVLDSSGNIDPRLVNEQEALRYRFDPVWDKRIAAFNKLVLVKPITRADAVKRGLLSKPIVMSV